MIAETDNMVSVISNCVLTLPFFCFPWRAIFCHSIHFITWLLLFIIGQERSFRRSSTPHLLQPSLFTHWNLIRRGVFLFDPAPYERNGWSVFSQQVASTICSTRRLRYEKNCYLVDNKYNYKLLTYLLYPCLFVCILLMLSYNVCTLTYGCRHRIALLDGSNTDSDTWWR